MYVDPFQSALRGNFTEARQHAMLDTTAKDPAAQKEAFHVESIFSWLKNDHTRQTIVAETIADRDSEYLRVAAKLANIGFGTAERGCN